MKGYITLYTTRAEAIKAINENNKSVILYEANGTNLDEVKENLYKWINENCEMRIENYPYKDPYNIQDGIYLKTTNQRVCTII